MTYEAVSPSGRTIYCRTVEEAARVWAWTEWVLANRVTYAERPLREPGPEPMICGAMLTRGALCHVPYPRAQCPQHGNRA